MRFSIDLKKQKMPLPELAVCFYFVLYFILPSMEAGSGVVPFLVGFVYTLFLMWKEPDWRKPVLWFWGLAVAFAAMYLWLTNTFTIAEDLANRDLRRLFSKTFQVFTMYFPALLAVRVCRRATRRQQGFLLLAAVATYGYVIFVTVRALIENPNISHSWQMTDELVEDVIISDPNVGRFYFICAMPILISLAVDLAICTKKRYMRLLWIAVAFGLVCFIVMSQYTLALLIAFLGIIVEIFRHLTTNNSRLLMAGIVIVAALFLPDVLGWIASWIPAEDVSIRFREIADFFLFGTEPGYNLGTRMSLYSETLGAFLDSPLYGNHQLDFNGHSTLLTVLSDTGMLGGIPFYGLIVLFFRRTNRLVGETRIRLWPMFVQWLLVGLFNPFQFAPPLSFAVWFVVPVATVLFEGRRDPGSESVLAEADTKRKISTMPKRKELADEPTV